MDKALFSVKILGPAQHDLEDIALLYLRLAGLESEERITDKILDAIDRLTQFPLSSPYIRDSELRRMEYHYLIVERYIVIYRLLKDTVFIYHIFDGRSDYINLFRNELENS